MSNKVKIGKTEVPIFCSHTLIESVDKLVPNPKNPNTHPEIQINMLAKIIKNQGWRNPIVVSKRSGFITKGHARLRAAMLNKFQYVPVDEQDYPNEAAEYADMIADNKIAELANMEDESIKNLIAEIEQLDPDFDLDLLGIPDIEKLMDVEMDGLTEDDEIPEPPEEPVTKLGDVWILGNHRLICGDATSNDDIIKLMAGKKADTGFTSPPYNANTHLTYGKGKDYKLYENFEDNKTPEEYLEFCNKSLTNMFKHIEGFIFWNVGYNNNSRCEFIKSIYPFIDSLHETISWKKATAMPVPAGLTRVCEFVFCFRNGKEKHVNEMFQTEYNFWEISNLGSQEIGVHMAAFPVSLPLTALKMVKGNLLLDPFLGTGSSLIACQKLGKICYGLELEPRYCDITVKRWEEFTGEKAHLEA